MLLMGSGVMVVMLGESMLAMPPEVRRFVYVANCAEYQ